MKTIYKKLPGTFGSLSTILPQRSTLRRIACLALLAPAISSAQEGGQTDQTRGSIIAGVSALISLESDDSFAAGTFKFKNPKSPDSDLDLYKFVAEFPLAPADNTVVPLFSVAPAYLKIDSPIEGRAGADIEIESKGFGLGTGVRITAINDTFFVTPRFKVEYSDVDIDTDNVSSQELGSLDPILNSSADIWTFVPSLEFQYQPIVHSSGTRFLLSSRPTYVYIEGDGDSDGLGNFSDASWIWRNLIGLQVPILDVDSKTYIRPSLARVDIHGAAHNGFGFNDFYEFSLDAATQNLFTDIFSEVGGGVTYIWEKEIQGWRIGFFGSF